MTTTQTYLSQAKKCLCAVIISILGFSIPYAIATPPNVQIVSIDSLGIVLLNTDKGSVAYCTNLSLAGTPPKPSSKCANIGSVGLSALGFSVTVSGTNVFILNKTNGNVFQCVTEQINGLIPTGACKAIANITAPSLLFP